MITRRYGQPLPCDNGTAGIYVDEQDALARFERILGTSRSASTVRLYAGIIRRWLAFGGSVDRLEPARLHAAPQAASNNVPNGRRVPPRLVSTFSDDQMLAMLSAPDPNPPLVGVTA